MFYVILLKKCYLPYLQLFFRADVMACKADGGYGLFSVWGWFSTLLGENILTKLLIIDCPPCFSGENMLKSLFHRSERCRSSCTCFL